MALRCTASVSVASCRDGRPRRPAVEETALDAEAMTAMRLMADRDRSARGVLHSRTRANWSPGSRPFVETAVMATA